MSISKTIADMSGREIIETLRGDSPLSRVHAILSDACGAIEQAGMQRHPPSPIEARRMELQTANRICALFGVGLS